MYPVSDTMQRRKSCSAGNRTRDLWDCSQKLWSLDHTRTHYKMYGVLILELCIWAAPANVLYECSTCKTQNTRHLTNFYIRMKNILGNILALVATSYYRNDNTVSSTRILQQYTDQSTHVYNTVPYVFQIILGAVSVYISHIFHPIHRGCLTKLYWCNIYNSGHYLSSLFTTRHMGIQTGSIYWCQMYILQLKT
jgi:hypothetical protein